MSKKQLISNAGLEWGMKIFSLFPLAFAQYIGWFVGRLLVYFPAIRMVHVAKTNIKLCLPYWKQQRKDQLLKASMSQAIMTGTEMPYLFMRHSDQVLTHMKSERGTAEVKAALAEGRGVLMLGPHIGCWEIAIMYLAKHFPTNILYTKPKVPKMEEIVLNARTRSGVNMLPADGRGVKALYQALANNEVVVMLTDQVPTGGKGASYVPFFDIDAKTMSFPTKLYKKYHPAIFLTYCVRLGVGKGFEMRFDSMEEDFNKAEKLKKVEDTFAHGCSLAYERIILEQPQQYQWVYKRFKYQPEGVEDYYKR